MEENTLCGAGREPSTWKKPGVESQLISAASTVPVHFLIAAGLAPE